MVHVIPYNISIYLDIIRFLAALAVVLGHAAQFDIITHSTIVTAYAHEAVIIFFVLSGYVISATSDRSGMTFRRFMIARLARIYSVAVPALLLGELLHRMFLGSFGSPVSFVLACFFLTESWMLFDGPTWNFPYWSLCYEMAYYAMFAGFRFLCSWPRFYVIAGTAVLAGPGILILMPIWLLGVYVCRVPVVARRTVWLGLGAVGLSVSGLIMFGLFEFDTLVRQWLVERAPAMWRLGAAQRFVTDYVLAIIVGVGFIGLRLLPERPMQAPSYGVWAIRAGAGCTLSLYLFHYPIMRAALTAYPTLSTSVRSATATIVAMCVLPILLSVFTEQRKAELAALFDRYLPHGTWLAPTGRLQKKGPGVSTGAK